MRSNKLAVQSCNVKYTALSQLYIAVFISVFYFIASAFSCQTVIIYLILSFIIYLYLLEYKLTFSTLICLLIISMYYTTVHMTENNIQVSVFAFPKAQT